MLINSNMPNKKSALIVLNYYTPYVSGLTNVARDVAEGLVKRGWSVTVVACQHKANLPLDEVINGVRVRRAPVLFKLGKGVISLEFVRIAIAESKKASVINLHCPMLEAGLISIYSKCPIVTTYQCDISLPNNFFNKLQSFIIDKSTSISIKRSFATIVTSDDYANHSRMSDYLRLNKKAIPAPCHFRGSGNLKFRDSDGIHVGFLGRIVEEKGIEYLVRGFRMIKDPNARLLLAGDYAEIAGGSVIDLVRKSIGEDHRIKVLGRLDDEDIPHFYSSLDIFALTSINSFEAFGITQVEAMMAGVPVVATNLPGVRCPVLETGMGKVVSVKSEIEIFNAISALVRDKNDWTPNVKLAIELYSLDVAINEYEKVFLEAMDYE